VPTALASTLGVLNGERPKPRRASGMCSGSSRRRGRPDNAAATPVNPGAAGPPPPAPTARSRSSSSAGRIALARGEDRGAERRAGIWPFYGKKAISSKAGSHSESRGIDWIRYVDGRVARRFGSSEVYDPRRKSTRVLVGWRWWGWLRRRHGFRQGDSAMRAGNLTSGCAYRGPCRPRPITRTTRLPVARVQAASRAHLEKAREFERRISSSGAREYKQRAQYDPSNRVATAKVAELDRTSAIASSPRGRSRRFSSCASGLARLPPSRSSTRHRASR